MDPQVVEAPASRFGARRLYRDAGSMAFATVANAALSAAFWAIAAKIFPPQELGVMTAVLAVIVAAGMVVASGVGDAYTALLPAVGCARRRVYRRGQVVFVVLASATGLAAAAATTVCLRQVHGSVGVGILVFVGIFAWSAFMLQNSTLISLGRARWLPGANVLLGIAKIAMLPLLAVTLHWHSVELAFIVSAFAIVVALQPMIRRIIASGSDLPQTATIPEDRALSEFNRLVVQTFAMVALSLGLLTATPFLVTLFAGPREGALFALTLSIIQPLDLLGAAMAISLAVHASSAPHQANTMARAILLRAIALTGLGALALTAIVPTVLRTLNPQYGQMHATAVIVVMSGCAVVRVVYTVWAALQRARRNLRVPLVFNVITAAILFLVMPGLAKAYGALGGAFAVLIPSLLISAGAAVHFAINVRAGKGPCNGPS